MLVGSLPKYQSKHVSIYSKHLTVTFNKLSVVTMVVNRRISNYEQQFMCCICCCAVVCDVSFPFGFAACCLQLLQLCPSALFICWQDAVLLVIKKLPAITTAFRTTTVFVLTMRRVTTFNCRKILLKCDIV